MVSSIAVSKAFRVLATSCLLALSIAGLAVAPRALAQDLQAIPALSGHVIDKTGTLDAAQLQALEVKLSAFEASRGSQIVVLVVATTLPEDITDYSQRVGDSWKVGRKDIGDGLLLVVAKNDRKVRIATTKALEGAIPDLTAKDIIDRAITPRFKQGDFAGGIDAAADQIMARISGENLPVPAAAGVAVPSNADLNLPQVGIALLLLTPIVVRVLAGLLGRKVASVLTGIGAGYLVWILTDSVLVSGAAAALSFIAALLVSAMEVGGTVVSSSGSSGDSDGGSSSSSSDSGGSFSSGGGGNFGGGGASGSW